MEALKASYGSDSDDSCDSPRASENTSCAPWPTQNPKESIRLTPPPIDLLQPPNSLDFSTGQGNRIRSFPHVEGKYALHIFIPVILLVDSSIWRLSLEFSSVVYPQKDATPDYICCTNRNVTILTGRLQILVEAQYFSCFYISASKFPSSLSISKFFFLHIDLIWVQIPSMTRKLLASSMRAISSHVPDLYVVDVDIALNKLFKDAENLDQVLLGREFHISLGRTVSIKVHQIDSIVAMLRRGCSFRKDY